jgi:hypothetical protein
VQSRIIGFHRRQHYSFDQGLKPLFILSTHNG